MSLAPSSLDRESGPPPTWVRWRILALLVAFSFMSWLNRMSITVAYNEKIKDEYGVSEEAIGSVYSTFFFAYMICMTPGGWFCDRFGSRLGLVVMGFGSGLFGALTGLAGLPSVAAAGGLLAVLFVVRFLMGVCSAPLYPAASRAVSFWIPPGQRTFANGLVQSGAALGIAFVFPIFGGLIDSIGWPSAFLCTGCVTAMVALAWTWYATNHPAQHPGVNKAEQQITRDVAETRGEGEGRGASTLVLPSKHEGAHWVRLLRNRSLVFLTISYAALGYMEYLFFFWMQYYFKDVLHVGTDLSRTYSMVVNLAFAAGMILGGWLADHFESRLGHGKGRALVPILGMAAGAAFLWLGLVVQDIHGIVTCLAVALAGVGAVEATVWTTAVELGGSQGGTAAAICNTGGNLGGLIAPVLTPFLSHAVIAQFGVSVQAGWQWGIALGGLICLGGAVLWLWVDPHER